MKFTFGEFLLWICGVLIWIGNALEVANNPKSTENDMLLAWLLGALILIALGLCRWGYAQMRNEQTRGW